MKKTERITFFFLLALLSLFFISAVPAERDLTLMIYMCGSNLESAYGSASADIQEMVESRMGRNVTVLVMTGGSENWDMFSTDETLVHEIGSRGRRTLGYSERKNMGDPENLTWLLRFGKENYPAKEYALILWDHGGGPLEGVCWDELFSLDHLTLEELTDAIGKAELGQKLSWIGFDACLMSSVEVASALSPYAEYMIASQETEPARGWNYAFLSGIGPDTDGAETGRLIVDSYFENTENSEEILTMACIDLSKISRITDLMSGYFQEIGAGLSAQSFPRLSALCKSTASFGKAVRGINDNSYDLMDLKDLVSHYGHNEALLIEALDEAIVYSRSSQEGSSGLSVYHLFENKQKYLESWRRSYQKLDFSPGYSRYLERFGTLLTGAALADWRGLQTEEKEMDENGVHHFSLQLTPEQQAEFSSAQLMILESAHSENSLSPIAVENAVMDENGLLTASYSGSCLYTVDENGNYLTGPLSFLLSEDGRYYYISVVYRDYSGNNTGKETTGVLYTCVQDEETNDLRIVRTYVYDEVTDSYTNRLAFSEEGFTDAEFIYFVHNVPQGQDPLPGFEDWVDYTGYLARATELTHKWHFHMIDGRNLADLYATFQVTDLQQNTYSSRPIPVENPLDTQIISFPESVGVPSGRASLDTLIRLTDQYPQVRLTLTVSNTTDKIMDYTSGRLILNGNRTVSDSFYMTDVQPGESKAAEVTLDSDDLIRLTNIAQISFQLTVREADNYSDEPEQAEITFTLPDADVSGIAAALPEKQPLAETESEGITWQLLDFVQNEEGDFELLMHVRNDTDEPFEKSANILLNRVSVNEYQELYVVLEGHTEGYYSFKVTGKALLSSMGVSNSSRLYIMNMGNAAGRTGSTSVERADLVFRTESSREFSDEQLSFVFSEPLPLNGSDSGAEPQKVLLEGDVSVRLEGIYKAEKSLVLACDIHNDSDFPAMLIVSRPKVNGSDGMIFDLPNEIYLPAHSEALRFLEIKNSSWSEPVIPSGQEPEELSFVFILGDDISDPVVIRFAEEPAADPEAERIIPVEDLQTEAATFPQKAMLLPESAVLTDPGNAHILRLTAPLTSEEAEAAESVTAQICLLTQEERDGRVYPVTRTVASAGMRKQPDGEFTATFSGLALLADGNVIRTNEYALSDGVYQLEGNTLYFFFDPEGFQPSDEPYASLNLIWDSDLRSTLQFTVEDVQGTPELRSSMIEAEFSGYDPDNDEYYRKNFYLEDVGIGVETHRVFFGTDRESAINTLDHDEYTLFPLKNTISLELLPVEELEGRLCLYYAVFYADGTRGDRIADWETGEIPESMGGPE